VVLWLLGDFNLTPVGHSRQSLKAPQNTSHTHAATGPAQALPGFWQALFDKLVEIDIKDHTHFAAASGIYAKIDRIFTSTEPSALLSLSAAARIVCDPGTLHSKGISDHAPFVVELSVCPPPKPENMPIHKECFLHPRYRHRLDALVSAVDLDALPTTERLRTMKFLMRDAALHARNEILVDAPQSQFTINSTISSMARAVWRNNTTLCKTLWRRSALAQTHLEIHDGKVSLKDPPAFADLVEKHKREFMAAESKTLEQHLNSTKACAKSRITSKINATWRLAKLWCPMGKRLSLHALRMPSSNGDGTTTVVREAHLIKEGLASAWAPTFAKKSIDSRQAHKYLKRFSTTYDWSLVSPPEFSQIEEYLAKAPHSASGPDGFPYIAWYLAGPAAYQTLWHVLLDLTAGLSMEISFNDCAMLFPAKGDLEADAEEVIRAPADTRPLSLKNTDNKAVTGIINQSVKPAIKAGAHSSQRGFVQGRQLLQNVVDLDTHNRAHSIVAHASFSSFDPGRVDSKILIAVLVFFRFRSGLSLCRSRFHFSDAPICLCPCMVAQLCSMSLLI